MRFTLLMYYAEQGDTGLSEEDMAPWRDAFDRYGRELDDAGILIAAEVLQPSSESAIYRVRGGQREDLVGVLSQDRAHAAVFRQQRGIVLVDRHRIGIAVDIDDEVYACCHQLCPTILSSASTMKPT